MTIALVRQMIQEELRRIRDERGAERFDGGKFKEATALFDELVADNELAEFLTLKAYDLLK